MEQTYANRKAFAYTWRDEAEYEAPDGQAEPKASSHEAARKRGAPTDAHHECDDPAAERNLGPDVAEQEQRQQPGHARSGWRK